MFVFSNKRVCFQVVVLYLSFLCARLLNLRNETRAARVIQTAWRKYRLNKDLQLYKVGPTAKACKSGYLSFLSVSHSCDGILTFKL